MNLKKENILIVDDNYDMLDLLQRNLKALNYHIYKASSVNEALGILKHTYIDLLITDLNMPEINGIELIKFTEEHYPLMPKLVITGVPSINSAVISIQSGAFDYLVKPFTNEELKKAVENSFVKTRNKAKKTPVTIDNDFSGIVGNSEQLRDLIEVIKRVKNNMATVLIQGDSGTGKELIAKAIHSNGTLAKMPFITVNCGGIPEGLMESELFGYVKGAFTGANESRIGLFQAASGGTIFLDEIGTASLSVQTRLLRVLQEKEITRVGSQIPEKLNVRIIAASNADLFQMVQKNTFREDLYYRLNVINIKTTPLRERKEDIIPIIDTFLKKYSVEYGKPNISITEKATEILLRYSWPGNVRELENIIQRMIIMSDDSIDIQQIPENLKYHITNGEMNILKSLKEYEKEQILKVLAAVDNNKTHAAKILQIDRKTLNQKII
ncbi:sigma-54-dependent transcriptional regulator [Flavobacterium hydatis]|uniref:Fis family transcriptional regulator n=1 Tax=Flavobacterium hydatis TaxID=991 RepID=A0A086A185_FLAHY|nr:sigma-54 dependent transcriptional regulator [Flavobacterium hydatis]KFF10449.1 Fis family transcriptional regulator [Flavobacterium hydatis]OXA89415.1 sigma-54-dependent Fis family transcriptional regulator [Flavobacterium hydatis]